MNNRASTKELYEQYKQCFRKIADVKYAIALLQWDQETYMPPRGAGFRAQQVASLSETAHEMFTSSTTASLLEELSSREDLGEPEKLNISLSYYDYKRQKKLPSAFVRTLSETVSKSYEAWIRARRVNAFSEFEADLATLVELKKQEADLLGFGAHPYDALLNDYEKGSTVAMLDKVFNEIRTPLQQLLDKINGQPQVDNSFLRQYFPRNQQWDFGMQIIRELGFDFSGGRQDISEHPFTVNFSNSDVRITTRIDENDFGNMLWSCIHETGHALYEQGLPEAEYGLPLSEYTSLGIHESQSRLWENNVGRSQLFWDHYFPELLARFPTPLGDISALDFYKGINKVQPSLIRTEADEVTYHFHVMIRYELEKQLIAGEMKTKQIPEFWNDHYKKYLGVIVADDKNGCLQDIHWSHGSFGYFPTYSLGSLYAAQFYKKAEQILPNLPEEIRNGRFNSLLEWLRTNIHSYGRRFTSEELCNQITGEPLNIRYFMDYATAKYQSIYGFS